MAATRACRAEVEARPNIGEKEPLAALMQGACHARSVAFALWSAHNCVTEPPPPLSAACSEYEQGAEIYRHKIFTLATEYSGIRRVRGDGNCFFRSVLFRLMEGCLVRRDMAEAVRVRNRVRIPVLRAPQLLFVCTSSARTSPFPPRHIAASCTPTQPRCPPHGRGTHCR